MAEAIQMVDLHGQYLRIKDEVDAAVQEVVGHCSFINGPQVGRFRDALGLYQDGCRAVTCANGTDALQIALMALGLERGDEVIVPAFTYVASAEVIALLGLVPVMVDVDYDTFNVTAEHIAAAVGPKTRAVIPVHLFGQSCDMEPVLKLASERGLYVIEDDAQALGAEYSFSDGRRMKTGTMGTVGCTSFFPTKNLGCFGDGGALFTRDEPLAVKMGMIANHGQKVKYHHSLIGCNSRLDTVQAAVLEVKLRHLDEYVAARRRAAAYYTAVLKDFDPDGEFVTVPSESYRSTHTYHQYTLKIPGGRRDGLKAYLAGKGIPSMVYYPLPLQEQEAFRTVSRRGEELVNASLCASEVLSIPMHTELTPDVQDMILDHLISFFRK